MNDKDDRRAQQRPRPLTNQIILRCLCLLVVLAVPLAVAAEWNWANPTPHGNSLRSAAHCAGGWVAVGQYGLVYTSADGIEWQRQESGTTGLLNGVTCNDTTIVAVGSAGLVATSPDGIEWTVGDTGSELWLYDIVWDPPDGGSYSGAFIAVGSQLQVLASPDGTTWTEKNPPSGDIGDVLWGAAMSGDGSLLVATGGNCYNQCEVSSMMVSEDHGDTWTTTTHTVEEYMGILNHVAWGDPTSRAPLFVAVHDDSSVLTSPDGLNWTARPTGAANGLFNVTWDGIQFIACGGSLILTSPDAVNWFPQTSNTDLRLQGIDAAGGLIVATGVAGTLITSNDGTTWTPRMAPTGRVDPTFRDVAWNGGLAVAADYRSSPTYGISPDGWSWTFRDDASGTSPAPAYGIGWAPVGGAGLFVSVGWPGRIVTSADGLIWTEQVSGVSTTINRVGWDGANLLVVGNDGVILTSADGVVWNPETSNTAATLRGLACGGSICVAAGDQVLITRSAGTWASTERPEGFSAVAHNGALFAAVGYFGVILTSPDGATWTSQVSGVETSLYDVEVVNGEFIVVGSRGTTLTSSDGVVWTQEISGTSNLLYGASSGRALAVGRYGSILHRGLFADYFESGTTSAWSATIE